MGEKTNRDYRATVVLGKLNIMKVFFFLNLNRIKLPLEFVVASTLPIRILITAYMKCNILFHMSVIFYLSHEYDNLLIIISYLKYDSSNAGCIHVTQVSYQTVQLLAYLILKTTSLVYIENAGAKG